VSLSRPATAKLLHVSLRTVHNWETGKVRIPYAAYKLVRLFNSYEIFHPIWKDWRIVGSRLITPEGHSLEAGSFHWLSLMARRSDAFGRLCREQRLQKEAEKAAHAASVSGLVFNSTSAKQNSQNQQNKAFPSDSLGSIAQTPKNRIGHNAPAPLLTTRFNLGFAPVPYPRQPRAFEHQQDFALGGAQSWPL
jgi:Phage protein